MQGKNNSDTSNSRAQLEQSQNRSENTYLLTPWSRVLLEKLPGSAVIKKFPAFLEPVGSSLFSKVPATFPYPELTLSSPHKPLPLPEDPS